MDVHITWLRVLLWLYIAGGSIFGLTWTRGVVTDIIKDAREVGLQGWHLIDLFLYGPVVLVGWPVAVLLWLLT